MFHSIKVVARLDIRIHAWSSLIPRKLELAYWQTVNLSWVHNWCSICKIHYFIQWLAPVSKVLIEFFNFSVQNKFKICNGAICFFCVCWNTNCVAWICKLRASLVAVRTITFNRLGTCYIDECSTSLGTTKPISINLILQNGRLLIDRCTTVSRFIICANSSFFKVLLKIYGEMWWVITSRTSSKCIFMEAIACWICSKPHSTKNYFRSSCRTFLFFCHCDFNEWALLPVISDLIDERSRGLNKCIKWFLWPYHAHYSITNQRYGQDKCVG